MPGNKAVDAITDTLSLERVCPDCTRIKKLSPGSICIPCYRRKNAFHPLREYLDAGIEVEQALAHENDDGLPCSPDCERDEHLVFIGGYRDHPILARYPKSLGLWYQIIQWLCFWRR